MSSHKNTMSPSPSSKANILLMISGSIAAYKSCFVISQLVQKGHDVQVVATPQAMEFIGPATLEGLSGKPVLSELFASQHAMDHIYLARWADLILLCPATANTLNKMSQGIADDLVTNLFLAHDFKKPFLVAPAMNTYMYQHPCTQSSLKKLSEMGLEILEPKDGSLACGEVGRGRLMEPEEIIAKVQSRLAQLHPSKNRGEDRDRDKTNPPRRYSVLITSGGTQEPIDAMRVLTNLSTGQTGASLAEALWDQGFDVHYLGAESAIKPQRPCTRSTFTSFNDLNSKLKTLLHENKFDCIIHSAAVSDFHISKIMSGSDVIPLSNENENTSNSKIKSTNKDLKVSSQKKLTLELEPNFKILPLLKSYSKNSHIRVVGFKFTATQDDSAREHAVNKLFQEGGVDLIIHNDRYDIDKAQAIHPFTIYSALSPLSGSQISSEVSKISIAHPMALAEALTEFISSINKGETPS